MSFTLEWQRGPISGRLILCFDGALWPRVEVFHSGSGEYAPVLFSAAGGGDTVLGRFALLAEAQAVAEQALLRLAGEPPHDW